MPVNKKIAGKTRGSIPGFDEPGNVSGQVPIGRIFSLFIWPPVVIRIAWASIDQ